MKPFTYEGWSNLAKVVYKRTYAREIIMPDGTKRLEDWPETVKRTIQGNLALVDKQYILPNEEEELTEAFLDRQETTAGRGLWIGGTDFVNKAGGDSLNNCWGLTADKWTNFVRAQDLLMQGGGVGMSVEHKFVCKLPDVVKNSVSIKHVNSNDADFIVPDSREGWNELIRKVLEAHFVTGKSFTYSTICVRGANEKIKGFGGTAAGPLPLIKLVDELSALFAKRRGKHLRPIDAADVICYIASMVVAGNVRRSALMILGDAWDREFLTIKRWDLSNIPSCRQQANYSIVAEDYADLTPLFWDSYNKGEPIGIFHRKNAQKYARMGEEKYDECQVTNPCVTGDTTLLTKQGLMRIDDMVDMSVEIWNGFEWSEVVPRVTGTNQRILKVKFNDGREIKCTPYHKFHLSTDYMGGVEEKEARSLNVGDKLIKCAYPIIEEGLEGNLTDLYTQGFYSADGTKNTSNINLYETKYDILPHLNVKSVGNETFNSFGTARRIVRLGMSPREKSYIPFEYNYRGRLSWLAGLLDGDGCELKEGGCQLASTDREFLKSLQSFLTTLGVNSKIVSANAKGMRLLPTHNEDEPYKKYWCKETNRICIGSTEMQELKALGLDCKRLKFDKSPQRNAGRFAQVVSIEELDGLEDEVYCFTEPKRHLGVFGGVITGQCGEIPLEEGEPCNLIELYLSRIKNISQFKKLSRLAVRMAIRTTCAPYTNQTTAAVIAANRRTGVGLTGILNATLYNSKDLDAGYKAIQEEAKAYCSQMNIPECIRLTTIKPSGTLGKLGDVLEGCHPAYSRYMIQRIRFGADDELVDKLREAGHKVEPELNQNGTPKRDSMVVEFYIDNGPDAPTADGGFDTWKQLDTLLTLQKHWSDNSVSITVYYQKEDIPAMQQWLKAHLKDIKSISFLLHQGHGFVQAPKEAITKEQYEALVKNVKPIDVSSLRKSETDVVVDNCDDGHCPVK